MILFYMSICVKSQFNIGDDDAPDNVFIGNKGNEPSGSFLEKLLTLK